MEKKNKGGRPNLHRTKEETLRAKRIADAKYKKKRIDMYNHIKEWNKLTKLNMIINLLSFRIETNLMQIELMRSDLAMTNNIPSKPSEHFILFKPYGKPEYKVYDDHNQDVEWVERPIGYYKRRQKNIRELWYEASSRKIMGYHVYKTINGKKYENFFSAVTHGLENSYNLACQKLSNY